MAGKSLGTLTIDLIAKVGGFVAGMDKAERASAKWKKQVEKDVQAVGKALAGVATAAVSAAAGVAAGGVALLKSSSQQITETDRWAKSLRMSTQELLSWQFAAEKAGVSGDQMADIFKDIGDKIGDAVLNKSGEAVEALNSLGLSAEKLSKVTPDKQLLAIGDALSRIGTNAEKTNILESLGNDLSKLLPLFDNNNQKLKQFLQLAKDYGVAPDPDSIDDLLKVNDIFQDLEAQAKGLKIEIAAGLAQIDLSPLKSGLDELTKTFTDPKVLQGLTDLVGGAAELFGWIAKAAAEAGKLADNFAGGKKLGPDPSTAEIERRIRNLEADLYDQGFFAEVNRLDLAFELDDKEKELYQLRALLKERASKNFQSNLPVGQATVSAISDFSGTNPSSSPSKTDTAFKSAEQSYLRQISLIETTGQKTAEVTELQQLQFELTQGKLTGLNTAQQERLKSLATEADRLNAVKKANEENLKVAEFVANLQRSNNNASASLNADVIGAGMGDKERDRMRERLDIERDFLQQRSQLQSKYQSGEITKSLYDRETSALNDALEDRLDMQDDYYSKVDQLESDWVAGASDGLQNWLNDASNYSSQAANAMESAISGITSNIADMLNGSKADWKDWSISVLKMIEEVALKMAVTKVVSSVASSFFSSGADYGAGSGTALQDAASNFQFNAKGGVYASSDLSAYSNSIVSSPTMFAFAKGAGLMGEAGPEAIMPLTRAADGSLGVRATGTSGGGGGAPQVNIRIESSGNTNTNSSSGYEQFGRDVGNYVDQRYRELVRRDISPGGTIWNMAKGSR